MAIPLFIAAFFHDAGIAKYYSDNIQFITRFTPSEKCITDNILILYEFQIYKGANYFNKGAMASMVHDKGQRAGLGRLPRLLAFNNWNQCYDTMFPHGIISLRVDADGVECSDKDIATSIQYALSIQTIFNR